MQLKNLIGNRLVSAVSGRTLDVVEPATGKVYAQAPRSQLDDVGHAVAAAKQALPLWKCLSPEVRADYLFKLAQGIEDHLDKLAGAESKDNGKPFHLARSLDIPRAAQNFRFFASAILQQQQQAYHRPGFLNYTLQQPVGIGVCISPWNLPLYLLTWKIAPALAAGNCVIAKPSEVTPLTAYYLSEIAMEIGLPAGVLNILHGTGDEVGQALCEHPDVAAISFTGSTRVGRHIALSSAGSFKKVSLEMGGKNAAVIFADAYGEDTSEKAKQKLLATVIKSSFVNQGQVCLCTSRLLIEHSIYDTFKRDFTEAVQLLTVGDPLVDTTDQGAVVSEAHYQKILSCLDTARDEGAHIITGGKAANVLGRCEQGFFIEPTVIDGLGPDTKTNQEEIFGPVVTLQSFLSEDEAVQLANATSYGLAVSLWTKDTSRTQRLTQTLDAGVVWVNTWMARDLRTPFGGIKSSGVGREGGWFAMRFWGETRNVCIAEEEV